MPVLPLVLLAIKKAPLILELPATSELVEAYASILRFMSKHEQTMSKEGKEYQNIAE